jgi:hypothetical protein
METKVNKELFLQILKANNIELIEGNTGIKLKKGQQNDAHLTTRITLSIIGLIIGMIIFLLVSSKFGILAMIGAGSFLMVQMNLKERKKEAENRYCTIGNGKIEIKEGYKVRKIKFEDISEFKTNIQNIKNTFIGKIIILTNDNYPYDFLEIFGRDEELIEDDLVYISHYIIDTYLSDSEEIEEE